MSAIGRKVAIFIFFVSTSTAIRAQGLTYTGCLGISGTNNGRIQKVLIGNSPLTPCTATLETQITWNQTGPSGPPGPPGPVGPQGPSGPPMIPASEMFLSADSTGNLQPAQRTTIVTVPAGKFLVLTDAFYAGTNGEWIQLIERDPVTSIESIKVASPFLFTGSPSSPSHYSTHAADLGIVFKPGTEVILNNRGPVATVDASWMFVGYFTSN